MKNLAPLVLLILVVSGCDISKYLSKNNSNTPSAVPSATAKPSPQGTPQPEVTPDAPSYIAILKKSAGKYPADIKLLDIPELKDRLKKLLGKDLAAMKAHWNVEVPMEITNGVFKGSACEAHNCGSNGYWLFVDLKKDNINVFHIEVNVTKHYFENGEIDLPKNFAAEITGDN